MSYYRQALRDEIMRLSFELHFCAVHKIVLDEIVPADVLCAVSCSPSCYQFRIGACQLHYDSFLTGQKTDPVVCANCGGTPHVSEPVAV